MFICGIIFVVYCLCNKQVEEIKQIKKKKVEELSPSIIHTFKDDEINKILSMSNDIEFNLYNIYTNIEPQTIYSIKTVTEEYQE